MKVTKNSVRFALVAACVALSSVGYAQTVLKFSHTDQQQGARKAGAQIFAKKVAAAIQAVIPCSRVGMMVIGLEVPHAHIHLIPILEI